jgi:hypothetical protein
MFIKINNIIYLFFNRISDDSLQKFQFEINSQLLLIK